MRVDQFDLLLKHDLLMAVRPAWSIRYLRSN